MTRPLTIGDLFERRVLDPRYAERPFLLFEDRAYTWLETWESSVAYANTFRHWCSRPDMPPHVGVLTDNRPEFVFALLGCALAEDSREASIAGDRVANAVEELDIHDRRGDTPFLREEKPAAGSVE